MIDLSVIRCPRLSIKRAVCRPVVLAFLMLAGIFHAHLALANAAANGQGTLPDLEISPNPLLLMDVATGNVLYQRDANKKWYPASLTKLMSAYVIFKAIEAGEISEDSV